MFWKLALPFISVTLFALWAILTAWESLRFVVELVLAALPV